MTRAEQMADALRLMGRAGAYHRTYAATHGRSYYAEPILAAYIHLQSQGIRAVQRAILGTNDEWSDETMALSGDDIRRQAEELASQLQAGAAVLDPRLDLDVWDVWHTPLGGVS